MKSWEREGKEFGSPEEKETSSFFSKAYENLVPDIVRKTVLMGLGGVSMTEDGVRRILSDLRLPRDEAKRFLEYVSEQSQKSKTDLFNLLSNELKGMVKNLNLEETLASVLTKTKIKIQTEISFEPLSGSDTPKIEFNTKIKNSEPESNGLPEDA